jgi:hypothetical protein
VSHHAHPAHEESLIKAIALLAVPLAIVLVVPAPPALASEGVRVAYTPRVFHVTQDDDYVDWNHVVALEFITPRHVFWGADRTHFGASVFDNSYGQFSQSIYAGLEWDWRPALGGELFYSLSPGLIHGYKEPHEDKLPLNKALGVGITLVPAIGWQRDALGFAVSLNGSAIALRISWSFMATPAP